MEKVARTLNALETIGIPHNQEAYQTSFSYIEGSTTLGHSSDHFTQANAILTIVSIWNQPSSTTLHTRNPKIKM